MIICVCVEKRGKQDTRQIQMLACIYIYMQCRSIFIIGEGGKWGVYCFAWETSKGTNRKGEIMWIGKGEGEGSKELRAPDEKSNEGCKVYSLSSSTHHFMRSFAYNQHGFLLLRSKRDDRLSFLSRVNKQMLNDLVCALPCQHAHFRWWCPPTSISHHTYTLFIGIFISGIWHICIRLLLWLLIQEKMVYR